MINIVQRRRLAPGQTHAAFVTAWRRAMLAIFARANGAHGARLICSPFDEEELMCISTWESVEHWRTSWGEGMPDPDGGLSMASGCVELARLDAEPARWS